MSEKKEFSLEDILQEERARRLGRPAGADPAEEAPAAQPSDGEAGGDTADLNAFATGSLPQLPEYEQQSLYPMEDEETGKKSKKKKKKKKSLFGRKRVPEFDESDDLYYGLQLKPLDEFRSGFDPNTGEFTLGQEEYQALFDDSKKAIDDEVEANFQRLQRERRRRVAEAVQNAGVDAEEIASEFGVVAPIPVTAAAGDLEAASMVSGEVPEIQRAMMETSKSQTMEIMLNPENDVMEVRQADEDAFPVVSEEAISHILEGADEPVEFVDVDTGAAEYEETAREDADAPVREAEPAAEEAAEPASDNETIAAGVPARPVIEGREAQPVPVIEDIFEYRARSVPTHIINVDVLQSALLSESEDIKRAAEEEEIRSAIRKKKTRKKEAEQVRRPAAEETQESIEDYTGPEDAKSIATELRGDMRELTLRVMITGVCTVLLALCNIIFGGRMSLSVDGGSAAIVYVVLTVVFLGLAIGVCSRTVVNGLKALFTFNANSDSAAAAAAVAVALQTLCAVFFRGDLADGKLHLYAVVLSAILFVNAAGKLTMIRRIHSNFRFITSREQKYAANIYDDYNNALKMSKDCVAERPVIAYQSKAGFLKRFLELSYNPDASEAASQLLAPIGLIASLVVCAACLLITRSVPTAISALAAASCACVAVANMLSVNLPVSRLCKTARRAGAMAVGYEAVEQFGNVNAVVTDAEEIFPRGTVVLNGIKAVGDKSTVEEAVIAATALMQEAGGPLAGVFEQVVSEMDEDLPEVGSVHYEPGGGIIGRVDGKTVYIGNRALLVNHRIEPPAKEEETQMGSGNKQVVYIAVDTAISAILTLTYTADRRRKNELQRLENSGVSVIVRTSDPNVTGQLVARTFGIDIASVGVIDGELGDIAHGLQQEVIPRADAVVATKGRVESLMSVVSACVEAKRTLSLVVAVQTAAVILGFVLVAFLACFGAMGQLSSLVLFIFEAFCLAVVLVLPKLRR